MGCGGSRIDPLDFVRERYPRTLAFLELGPHSRAFADLFARSDRNNDQRLAVSEFLKALHVTKTRAAVRLFSICDMDGSGALDFRELIFTIWHICTVDDRGLSDVVFDIYDEDTNGMIDPDDLYRLLVDCYGKAHMEKPEIERILRHAETSGSLTRHQFAEFAKRSPQTMKQMIDMQLRVREETLGAKAWAVLEKKRRGKTDPAFRPENWQDLFTRLLVMDIQTRKLGESQRVVNETKASERAIGETPSKAPGARSGRVEDLEDEDLDEDYRRGEADARERDPTPKRKKKHKKKAGDGAGGAAGAEDDGEVEAMSLKSSRPAMDRAKMARKQAREQAAQEAAAALAAVDSRG